MSESIQCWQCGTRMTLDELASNDGDCPRCEVEVHLSEYLDNALSKVATLEAELARTAAQRDAILQHARAWAGEAKTQRSTVLEVGEILGGIPDWGPIAAGVEAMAAENAKLRAELERLPVDGWKLAPVEPTEAMKIAGNNAGFWCVDTYRAMLAAAPSAPKADPIKVQLLEALKFAVREQSGDLPTKEQSAWLLNARKVLAETRSND